MFNEKKIGKTIQRVLDNATFLNFRNKNNQTFVKEKVKKKKSEFVDKKLNFDIKFHVVI
jgi:hypothetical protein